MEGRSGDGLRSKAAASTFLRDRSPLPPQAYIQHIGKSSCT
ncbi:hypothetical protein DESPIG_01558 [Desulfovibrio piger ATCC 29098]|uniref:Uncharacterized protein n=1 Tax=Desulfovibrio piger ATCC 29098 TaxID=411464 RepID=B6WU00_9BACT|nr:hypothetical protein DESPIG_01558 [Desulfovibrio piger ATCC 29098]